MTAPRVFMFVVRTSSMSRVRRMHRRWSFVPENSAVKIRDDMPLYKAALIGCAVTTGAGAVINTARVKAGSSLAVFGTGGIGLNAIQGGRLCGAYPLIAVDVADNKLEFARALGATH